MQVEILMSNSIKFHISALPRLIFTVHHYVISHVICELELYNQRIAAKPAEW